MKRITFIVAILLGIFFSGFSTSTVSIFSTSAVAEEIEEMEELEAEEEPEAAEAAEEELSFSFPSYINEATLAADYIYSSLPTAHPILRASRPSGLIQFPANSPNRNLYLALRSEITGIANGTNEKQYDDDVGGMSTVFEVSAGTIFPNISFTASDLGVGTLFTTEGDGDKYGEGIREVSEAARTAFWSRVNDMKAEIRFADVALCIVNDSPYELYWFGRGARVVSNSFTMEVVDDGEEPRLELTGSYTVLFSVNVDYAVPNATTTIDGTEYRTWVDTDKFGSVARAKKKIEEIKTAIAGMNDEQKLNYFATQICSLVSYNGEAEREFKAGTREYGDPWQLVWVFDSKSEQKVVCEGYSKAFAYLCELCTSEAEAIIVWGSIPGGNHIWNVVRYQNHNYLVDLTNYDLGYDLFMVGADGSPADGYDTKALKGYVYNRVQTKRGDEELTLAPYSYSEWKAATSEAPVVKVSSDKVYPGYQVAVKVESSNGVLPVDQIIITRGSGESEIYDGDVTEIGFWEDTEITIAAVVDGITTPAAEATTITVAEEPETVFSLPAGSLVESEAFSGIAAELVQVNGNDVAPGAFDEGVVLAVGEIGDWFESGYRFVVTVSAGEK